MARVKLQRKSESADEWLDSQGYYRKPIAKDGSCLFRAVSEQVFDTQVHHFNVRVTTVEFMDRHRELFEDSIDGYFDNYLCCLRNPKEWGGRLEMNAMSLMYRKEFLMFKDEDKQLCQITNNNFEDKIRLYCTDSKHYDSVYPKSYLESAAFCQSIVYDLLYKNVFNLGPEVDYAVEKMLHDKEYAKQRKDSSASYDGIFDKSSSPSPDFLLEQPELEIDDVEEGGDGSEIRRALARGYPPFPYKVAKALDPDIYRNVELDVWNEQKKKLLYEPGAKCLVRNEKDKNEMYNAHVQEIDTDNKTVTVYIEELGEKQTVGIDALEPLPTSPQKTQHWNCPVKPFKSACGYYQKGVKSPVPEYDQSKSKKKTKKKLIDLASFTVPSAFAPRSQYEAPAGTFSRGRASPPVLAANRSPSPRLKWSQSGQQNQATFNRYRPKNNNVGARHTAQGTVNNQLPPFPDAENGHKKQPDKEIFEFQDNQELGAYPALPKPQVPNQGNSAHNGNWCRNNEHTNGNGRTHQANIQTTIDQQMQKDVCINSVPHTSTPPIPISTSYCSNPNVSKMSCNVHNTVLSPNSPPFETSPISLSHSPPMLSQELNQQMNCSMAMQPQMLNQQTPPPPTYGYLQYPQMYTGTVMPYTDVPSQTINFNVTRSQDLNGSDLPLNDLPTLRFFFNLGHDYFRMSSIYSPVQQQQPYTVWNYGTPITYSSVSSFTPPPMIGSETSEPPEEPSNGNGQCSRTGERGVDQHQLDAFEDIYENSTPSYDLIADYTSMYIASNLVADFKNNLVVEQPKQNVFSVVPQDHMMYSAFSGNYGSGFDMPMPPVPSSAPWGCGPHEPEIHAPQSTRRAPFHPNFHPQRGTNLPPRFQRRNSNGNNAQHKDKYRYEGQPLRHVGNARNENLSSEESVPNYSNNCLDFSVNENDNDDGLFVNVGDINTVSLNQSSPLLANITLPSNPPASSLGYYQQASSPTSTPAMLATPPPTMYYSQPHYVYHQPPPQTIPQQMSFMPAAVQ
uniref:OTU domain-containing protein n=1 Tax=Strigamia maritima TaxID=126957 RepID=T1JCG5_STRMM